MALYGVISNLLSFGAQLIPAFSASARAPSSSSSSSPQAESQQIETELKQLMRMLERIKATLYDAEMREIRDLSVKLWLKELQGVAYDAEDVLDEYRYEVLKAEVEARDATSPLNSRKRKLIQVPDGMLDQIRQIRNKFSEIEKDRLALRLTEDDGPRRCNSDLQIPPTSHLVVESDIIGREREKKNLIDVLSSANDDGKNVSVVTIVGTGGIGKTTLVKLVYNDQKIKQKFGKIGWVCVSEDFNVQRLTREVLESITGKSFDLANLSALQDHMKEEISDKKVFLVLDDVWNENRSLWDLFKAPFKSASLMKILVTTRNEPVAQIMQTVPTIIISYMSKEQSWKLFQHYAFGEAIQNMGPNLLEIGKQIMEKCGMLPLAVKSIASLLRNEPKEESWREILESELWESSACNEIFRPLQISYVRLPTYLKPCLLYCSMFPRDYKYSAEELVKLWISQGYVQNNGLKNAKKIGLEYVKQLWQRSFFQGEYVGDECMENIIFTLHDMVHDLARLNSGHACYSIEGDVVPNFPAELYHLYVYGSSKPKESPPPDKFSTLRSCVVKGNVLTILSSFDFSQARYLRTLELYFRGHYSSLGQHVNYLESHFSMANLKHLRYLEITGGFFKRLPECMCSLYNLQFFTLMFCDHLTELPKSIGNFVSLEELAIKSCDRLKEFPPDMGNLVSLEKLMVSNFHGRKVFPESLCQLKVMQELEIDECFSLEELPPDIGNLVSLKKLIISNSSKLRVLPKSLCQLKVLKELEINECSQLEELPSDLGNLVCLKKLKISYPGNLRVLPMSLCQLKILQELEITGIFHSEELPPDLGNLVSLKKLIISDFCNLRVLPVSLCQLKVLQELEITKCFQLEELPSDMGNLTNLQTLNIFCGNIVSLPPSLNKIIQIPVLQVVFRCRTIGWLENFVDLEETLILTGLWNVKSLEDVHCANIARMHNLEVLILHWDPIYDDEDFDDLDSCVPYSDPYNYFYYSYNYNPKKSLCLSICRYEAASSEIDHCSLMARLRPHPNLKDLHIQCYGGLTFPDWFGNSTLCASLENIILDCCESITFLPFGSLEKLKYLQIWACSSMQFIHEQSLPLVLEQIEIFQCQSLISVTGIERLKSLIKFNIGDCCNLSWLESSGKAGVITVSGCPKVREFCLQHDIDYMECTPIYKYSRPVRNHTVRNDLPTEHLNFYGDSSWAVRSVQSV